MRAGQLFWKLIFAVAIALFLNHASGAEKDPFLKRLEESPRHHQ